MLIYFIFEGIFPRGKVGGGPEEATVQVLQFWRDPHHMVLAAHLCGAPGASVYDGLWYEWFTKAPPENTSSPRSNVSFEEQPAMVNSDPA